jgi:hypothetical protein
MLIMRLVLLMTVYLSLTAMVTDGGNSSSRIDFTNDESVVFMTETVVELIGPPHLTPDCGYFAFESAMLFKVVQSEKYMSEGDSVVMIFRCPEGYGPDFFERTRQYVVELVDAAPETGFGWSTLNVYKDAKLRTFWATSCKPRFFSGPLR